MVPMPPVTNNGPACVVYRPSNQPCALMPGSTSWRVTQGNMIWPPCVWPLTTRLALPAGSSAAVSG